MKTTFLAITAALLVPSVAQAEEAGSDPGIVVTAQKRSELLKDVPVAVSIVDGTALRASGQSQLADYFAQVPGLDYASNVRGAPLIAIRGLVSGTDLVNPTVGIVVDDVPFGAPTALGGGDSTPDLDPNDLLRVEVLRGPQGTLYGANSLGGLVKFVTVDPSTKALTGQVSARGTSISSGHRLGYAVRGSVNVPLSDTLAVLASGFSRSEPGYIDNPVHGLRDVNAAHAAGGRLALLWQPTASVSVKLGALYQHSKSDGAGHVEVAPELGQLQQYDLPRAGLFERTLQAYSATIKARSGRAEIASITSYTVNRIHDTIDESVGFSFLTGSTQAGLGLPDNTTGSVMDDRNTAKRFSQELRLSTPLGDHIDWQLGGFFTSVRSPYVQTIFAADPGNGAYLGEWAALAWTLNYRELAGFTDLTFHLSDRFDVQIGARETHIRQAYHEIDSGPLVPVFLGTPSPLDYGNVITKADSFTYLFTPRFKLGDDLMVYARLASGFRPGSPNQTASAFGLPLAYKPDKAQSYELGIKGDLADHTLSFDASLYLVDWKDIQLSFINASNGFGFIANGSKARSKGAELSVTTRPRQGLAITAWAAWNDARLTQNFPADSALFGAAGDRLPFSPRWSGSIAATQTVALGRGLDGRLGATWSYVGNRVGNFLSAPSARQTYGAYGRLDMQAGLTKGPWALDITARNVTNSRGLLYGGLGTLPDPAQFQTLQPRTIGLTITRDF